MKKPTTSQLQRIHANKTQQGSHSLAAHVGEVARTIRTSGVLAGPAWRRRLVAVIQEYAGEELLNGTTIIGVQGGVLRLRVAEPALLYHLRLQWEQRLLLLLRQHLPDAGIRAVRFTGGPLSP